MGMTIAEKIMHGLLVWNRSPGDIHTVEVDRLMSNDGTTHLTIDNVQYKIKASTHCRCEQAGLDRGSQRSV